MLPRICRNGFARKGAQVCHATPAFNPAVLAISPPYQRQLLRQYSPSSPRLMFEKVGRWFEMKKFERDVPWAQMETAAGESFDIYQAAMSRKQECEHDEAARLFEMSADLGFTEAMVQLAICYREGWGVVKNESEAIKHFQRAADCGHALAHFMMGMHHAKHGDKDQAAKHFISSREMISPENYELAVRHQNGENVEFAVDETDEDSTEINRLAEMGEKLMYGAEDTPVDPEAAVEYLFAAADKRHITAQFEMGLACATGTGVEQDMKRSFRFFKLAADQGHAASQSFVGESFLDEPVDLEKAVLYLSLAAEQKFPSALRNLGYLYASGNGVEQNMQLAVDYFKEAAKLDDAEAVSTLATCYLSGAGVEQDADTAEAFFAHADALGRHEAFYTAGQVCEKGVDLFGNEVPKNILKAVEYYQRAADRGNPDALYALGGCYLLGNGVTKNKEIAMMYLQRAADQGHEKAATMYGKIEGKK